MAFAGNVPDRIVAIGDLHADLKATQDLFKHVGLINADGKWIAEDTVVVQTGDVTDRGPDGKNMLEWLRRQQRSAQNHSSELIILMGNHESMNIRGDWRYVSPKDIQSFGSLSERKAALQPQAEWGSWMANLPTTAQVQDIIFVHGGISPQYAAPSSSINESVRKAHMGLGDRNILGSDGPLWYRDYLRAPESDACPSLKLALKKIGAKRMVVGHTTQRSGKIKMRCDGAIFGIDTGISSHYGKNLSALEFSGGLIKAIYLEKEEVLYKIPAR